MWSELYDAFYERFDAASADEVEEYRTKHNL